MSLAIIFLAAAVIIQAGSIFSLRQDMDLLIRSLPLEYLKEFIKEYEKGKRK